MGYPNLRVVLTRALKTGVTDLYTCTRAPPLCSFEGGRACLSFDTKFGLIISLLNVELILTCFALLFTFVTVQTFLSCDLMLAFYLRINSCLCKAKWSFMNYLIHHHLLSMKLKNLIARHNTNWIKKFKCILRNWNWNILENIFTFLYKMAKRKSPGKIVVQNVGYCSC